MIESELVIKCIIEKLLSYTITKCMRLEINQKLNPYYNKFIHTILTDTLNLHLITYDSELISENSESNKKEEYMFYENRKKGYNDWSFTVSPSSCKIDRAASTLIKLAKTQNVTSVLKIETRDKQNLRNTSNLRDDVESRTKSKKANIKKEEIKQVDLDNIQIYLEPPEITDVRKKKEEEWKKKEDDSKKKIQKDKERQEENNEYIKKQKDFEKKNVTADSTGCPILIKGVGFGFVNDFILAKHGISDKELLVIKTDKSENKEVKEVREISPSKKDEKTTAIVSPTKEPTIQLKKEEKKKHGPITEKVTVKAEIKENIKKILVFDSNVPKPITTTIPITQPAGSNYDYFVPSVGVTISEGSKHKTGGKNFYSLFSKPSIYDYRQLVRDSAHTHYGTSFLQESEFPKNEQTDKMALTANQLSLPPLTRTFKDREEKQTLNGTNMESMKVSNKIHSLKSVLDALDLIPEYDKKLEDEHFRNTNTDMFKNKKNNLDKEKDKNKQSITASLEEINKFNHSIMRNNLWGNSMNNKPKPNTANKMPIKPDTKELEKEMGKTIVNVKLPRSRHLTKVGKMKK